MKIVNNQRTKIMVLGSGTCVPSDTRFPSSYFIKIPSINEDWLIDLGSGALQRLALAGGDYKKISRVFLSHTHPDHISSFLPLLQALNYTPNYNKEEPLFFYGNEETIAFLIRNMDLNPKMRPKFPCDFIQLKHTEEISEKGWKIIPKKVSHSTDTFAFRFNINGIIFTYGADTGLCDDIFDLCKDAELIILECSFRHGNSSRSHLTTSDAGNIAHNAHAKTLVLTHFYPEIDGMSVEEKEAEVRLTGYDGKIFFANDLDTFEL